MFIQNRIRLIVGKQILLFIRMVCGIILLLTALHLECRASISELLSFTYDGQYSTAYRYGFLYVFLHTITDRSMIQRHLVPQLLTLRPML
jgi:hypothetical protein